MQGWGTISEEGPLSPPQALEAGPLGPEGEGDAGGNGSGQDVITRGHGLTVGRGQRGMNGC